MRGGWIYILTNGPNGTLYIGVTSNLIQRVWQHREGVVPGFTKRYGLKRLVYFEAYDDISVACDLSIDAVRSRLHRARQQLREALGGSLGEYRQRGVRIAARPQGDE